MESTGAKVTNNLVALMVWDGAYQDRYESYNLRYPGAVTGLQASNLVLVNNTVAGSERFGFKVGGQSCDTKQEDRWTGNIAHGALIGQFSNVTFGL